MFHELAWVGGCVTAPAARTSPGRWCGSQSRAPWCFGSIRTAHHGGHGAVDVMGPVAPPGHARVRGGAGVYTNRQKWPLSVVLGHLCTLLRLARVTHEAVGTQECTQIGGSGLLAPFWVICVHCCDSRGLCELPWGRRSVHRSAEMASRHRFGAFVYTVATREGHARVAPPLAGVFAEAATHTNPRGAPYGDWTTSIGTHRRKVRSLSARRAPLVRREMRQAH